MLRNRSGFQRKLEVAALGGDSFSVVQRQASPQRLIRLFCSKSPAIIQVLVMHQLVQLGLQPGIWRFKGQSLWI